jgi:CheY-like chemotaxis protein
MLNSSPVVMIFNSSDDIVELLRGLFERDGFIALSAHVDEVRRGRIDVEAYMEQHQPVAVVYDLIPPYDRHAQFLDHLRNSRALRDRLFVITSANAAAAREIAGRNDVFELSGSTGELEAIVGLVKRAAHR